MMQFQNYETSESKLRREFEKYGKIKKVYFNFNYFKLNLTDRL